VTWSRAQLLRGFLAAALAAGVVSGGCIKGRALASGGLKQFDSARELMGTLVTITIWAPAQEIAREAGEAAFARIAEIESLMSRYRAGSELSKINRRAYEESVPISDDTLAVLGLALEHGRLSDGAFDVSMAPLGKLWKSAAGSGRAPGASAIEKARACVGYVNIALDEKKRTVRFLKPGMEIDLGGIAKGYAVDQALAELRRRGITAALVNAGGDIATMGRPPEAKTWRVGIQKPNRRSGRLPEVVLLTTGAVATSGDYERFVEIGGERYSHIIDPRTGMPVKSMSSVTVIAPDAATADILATACSVLGPKRGVELTAQLANVEVMYAIAAEDGPAVVKSQGFDKYVE